MVCNWKNDQSYDQSSIEWFKAEAKFCSQIVNYNLSKVTGRKEFPSQITKRRRKVEKRIRKRSTKIILSS